MYYFAPTLKSFLQPNFEGRFFFLHLLPVGDISTNKLMIDSCTCQSTYKPWNDLPFTLLSCEVLCKLYFDNHAINKNNYYYVRGPPFRFLNILIAIESWQLQNQLCRIKHPLRKFLTYDLTEFTEIPTWNTMLGWYDLQDQLCGICILKIRHYSDYSESSMNIDWKISHTLTQMFKSACVLVYWAA